jgi:acyl carrier protein
MSGRPSPAPPSLAEFVGGLAAAARAPVPADVPLGELGLESVGLVEWFYAAEDAYGVEFDAEVLDRINEWTAADLHAALVSLLAAGR